MAAAVYTPALTGDTEQGQQPNAIITPRKTAAALYERSASHLRLDVKMVLIPVTVTDAADRQLTNLTRDRFRILEDGVEQQIKSFSQEEAPVSLGLLFDSSGSMKNRIAASVESLRLLFQTRTAGDEYFVVQFADEPRLLGGFTSDPAEIHQRLGFVQARGWTALLDAIALSAHHMRSAVNRARVLLILSDGSDNNSRYSESEIKNLVVESDLRVYGIGLSHRPRLLQQLAEITGGKVLIAQNVSDLPDVVERLSREIRAQYLLGYTSSNPTNDGKYRKVKVEVAAPSGSPALHVSWRHGYFAPAE
ncbi:MAG: VWA domain-containing protein [Candidatus Solibacter sp.]